MNSIFSIKNINILGVFAHPDDDVFGPGGTIYQLSQTNNFYEVLITNGQAGTNQLTNKKDKNLGWLRKKEAQKSAKILGIKKIFFLNYQDAQLSNHLYHQISQKIDKIIKKLDISCLLTYEPQGVSGHLDHIFSSMISSYLAEKHHLSVLYFCLNKKQRQTIKNYFIYFPEGYPDNQIDLKIKLNKDLIEKKIQAINCHQTQKKDGQQIINNIRLNQEECFLLKRF